MKVYNTLTRKKEEFVPVDEKEIRIYVCGPTVYNYFHIGNARPFVVFDTLRRYLEYRGNKVKFVQNFTDVDDKIINRAAEEGTSPSEVSEKYIEEFKKEVSEQLSAEGLNFSIKGRAKAISSIYRKMLNFNQQFNCLRIQLSHYKLLIYIDFISSNQQGQIYTSSHS